MNDRLKENVLKLETEKEIMMRKNTVLSMLLLVWIALILGACATTPPQEKYRGQERSIHAEITPLKINPNAIKDMTRADFEEYMRRLKVYNQFVRDTGYASAYQAYAEKQWVNDPEGGPPSTPDGWNDANSYITPRAGVFGQRSQMMRHQADKLWMEVQEALRK